MKALEEIWSTEENGLGNLLPSPLVEELMMALVLRPLPGADGHHRVGLLEMLRADQKGDEGNSWHWFNDGAEEMVMELL